MTSHLHVPWGTRPLQFTLSPAAHTHPHADINEHLTHSLGAGGVDPRCSTPGMRGQRLRVTAESVRPWLHTSWDTHTGQTKQLSPDTSPVSPEPETWVDYLTFFFCSAPHIRAQTHTHTAPRALTHLTAPSVSLSAGLNGPASHFSRPALPLQPL